MKQNRKQLLTVLDSLTPGLDSKDILEHSASFIFTGTEVRTYNDQVACRRGLKTEFTGAVTADKLLKLLRGLDAEEIEIGVDDEGAELRITSGKAKAGITLEATKADWLKALTVPKSWSDLPSGFNQAVRDSLFSAAKDLTRPVLTCIHLSPKLIESCDNYRATRCKLSGKPGPETIISASSLQTVLPLNPTKWALSDGWGHFQADGVTISCRTFTAEKYPDLKALFTVEGEVVTLPEGIKELVGRAHVFAEAEFTQDERLKIELKKNEMTISGRNQKGWYSESVKCSWKGDPLAFEVHPTLFGDMVGLLQEVIVGESTLRLESENLIHIVALSNEG